MYAYVTKERYPTLSPTSSDFAAGRRMVEILSGRIVPSKMMPA